MLKLLNTLGQLRKYEHWTRQQLETYQAKALLDLRQYAYKRSPFYQKFHKGLTGRPLQELPVLTKAMMMEHFDELVTDRNLHLEEVRASASQWEAGEPYRQRYWINATSGSEDQSYPPPADGNCRSDQSLAYVLPSRGDCEELVAA